MDVDAQTRIIGMYVRRQMLLIGVNCQFFSDKGHVIAFVEEHPACQEAGHITADDWAERQEATMAIGESAVESFPS